MQRQGIQQQVIQLPKKLVQRVTDQIFVTIAFVIMSIIGILLVIFGVVICITQHSAAPLVMSLFGLVSICIGLMMVGCVCCCCLTARETHLDFLVRC